MNAQFILIRDIVSFTMDNLIFVLIGAAAIDSINPCAFSVLLITLGFLLSLGFSRGKVLAIGGTYVLGVFFAYISIGLGILQTLTAFGAPHFMAKAGALILIIFGLINIAGEIFPSFPIKLTIPASAKPKIAALMAKASVPTAFVLGLLVAMYEFPCTGGPYFLVLGLLHDQKTFWQGFGYLIIYNLIFVAPLLIILVLASNKTLHGKVEEWKKTKRAGVKIWGAVTLIILGFIILITQ